MRYQITPEVKVPQQDLTGCGEEAREARRARPQLGSEEEHGFLMIRVQLGWQLPGGEDLHQIPRWA